MIGGLERDKAKRLIWGGNFTIRHQEQLMITLMGIPDDDFDRFEDFIDFLNENQVDHINAGRPYNQTDISIKLKNEL